MFIHILEHQVQYAALAFMAVVYISKIIWILRFKPMKERTPSKGSERRAIAFSFLSIAMPWTMLSMRQKWYKYIEFVIFHIGVAAAIIASFIIPEAPEIMKPQAVQAFFQVIIAAAFLITLIRLGRRIFSLVNKVISHPDDYFSLVLMAVWFFVAYFAMPNDKTSPYHIAYFALTAFLIIYVPFSKMSHYILWPFTRFYFGKHFGHRGVYPKIMAG